MFGENTTKIIIEAVGYLGTALVVISMLMTSITKLRIFNSIGCVINIVYGFLCPTIPVAVLNICLFVINVYQLIRLFSVKKQYDQVVSSPDDPFITYLLNKNYGDIHVFFPTFTPTETGATVARLILCGKEPAGLLLGKETGEDGKDIEIVLDYALPAYRDASVGRYLYTQLANEGYRSLTFNDKAPKHTGFMKKIGYEPCEDGSYRLDLARFLK